MDSSMTAITLPEISKISMRSITRLVISPACADSRIWCNRRREPACSSPSARGAVIVSDNCQFPSLVSNVHEVAGGHYPDKDAPAEYCSHCGCPTVLATGSRRSLVISSRRWHSNIRNRIKSLSLTKPGRSQADG